jgi:hypothetical protein
MQTYRQGDVLIVRISAAPTDAQPIKPGPRGYVLAEGEVTGHAHTIAAGPNVRANTLAGQLFLRVAGDVVVTHEEHTWITLPPGDYQVVRQVEYTPQELRRVMD